MHRDPYAILQLAHHAEQEVIEAAYRRLARKYHPDVNRSPEANVRMQEINWAYEVLKDPVRRAEYDRRRKRQQDQRESYPPPPPREERQHRATPRQEPQAPKSSTEPQESESTSELEPAGPSILLSLASAVLLVMSSYGLTFAFGQVLVESRADLLYIPSLIGLLWSFVIAIVGAHGWKPGQAIIFRFFIALMLSVFPMTAWIPCYWSGKAIARWVKGRSMGKHPESDVFRLGEKSQPRWPVVIYGVVAMGLAIFVFGDVASIIESFDKGTEVTATPVTVYVSTYQGPGITMKYPTAWELEPHLDENSIQVWDPSYCCFILVWWRPVTAPEGADPEMLYRRERDRTREDLIEHWGEHEDFKILREYRLDRGAVFEVQHRDEDGAMIRWQGYRYIDVESNKLVIWSWDSTDKFGREDTLSYNLALRDVLFDMLAQSVTFEPTVTSAPTSEAELTIPTDTPLPLGAPTPALDDAEAYYVRGTAYLDKDNYDRAIAEFDKAIQLEPDFADAYFMRGIAYLDKDNHDRAIVEFDKAIQLGLDYGEAYFVRGIAYFARDDYDRAIAEFDKAIQLEPDYGEVYLSRGIAYVEKDEYDLGIAEFDKAVELMPDYAKAYGDRGIAYMEKGEYDLAIADYDKAIQLEPDFADAYFMRGIANKLKGEKEKAIADFKKVLELSNDPLLRQQAEEQLKATETPRPTATPTPTATSSPGVSDRDKLLDAVTAAREAARGIAWDMDKCVTLRREDCGDFDMVILRYEELLAAPTFTVRPDLQYVYNLYREAVDGILAKGGDMYDCIKNDCPAVPFITWAPVRTAIEEAERKFNDAIVLLGGSP